jgi:hypothetical protein
MKDRNMGLGIIEEMLIIEPREGVKIFLPTFFCHCFLKKSATSGIMPA